MRLIDADRFAENLINYNIGRHSFLEVLEALSNEPTAYDPDKVAERLEEERELSYADFDRYVDEVSPCLDAEYDDQFSRGLERAAKIVKAGDNH